MAFWVSSDLHIAHLNALTIMPFRPWDSIENMNEGLIANHNSVVKPEDTIIWLGDLIMGKKFENVPKYLPRLNGRKLIILGNHDYLPSEIKKPEKLKQYQELYFSNGINTIYDGWIRLSEITNDPKHVNIKLCHFPSATTEDDREIEYEQRYKHLRPVVNDNEVLWHGHTHSQSVVSSRNSFHVGVDAWDYKPVSLELLLKMTEVALIK